MTVDTESGRAATTPVEVRQLGTIDYTRAWELQRELATARAEGLGPSWRGQR